MNLRRGWWILGMVAACALLAAGPVVASEGYFSNADGELTSSDLVTYTAAGHGGPADPSLRTAGCCETGVIGYMEYLHMGAKRGGMDVAVIAGNPAPNVFTQNVLEAQYGRDSGFRVGLGYQFANCWDVTWNYTYFWTDGATAVSTVPGDGNTVEPTQLLSLEDPVGMGNFAFRSTFRSHVSDLDFGRWIRLDDSASIRLFGGFRYAIIDQSLEQLYAGVPVGQGVFQSGSSLTTQNMDAYGIRLGIEGRMNLPSGFSLFGRTAASVLAGHFDLSTAEAVVQNQAGAAPVVAVVTGNDSITQAVPVLEAAVGVAWTYNHIEVSGGYEVNAWYNMAYDQNDLLLDGFFVRAAFTR
mgnify:CR=1 FL=1